MCSISGVLVPPLGDRDLAILHGKFLETVCAAQDRGRDSHGYTVYYRNASASFKEMGTPSMEELPYGTAWAGGIQQVVNNNRAEPTTEWVPQKREQDIQPFTAFPWTIAHNGTIANDKELAEKYKLVLDTNIDSAVIPAILARYGVQHLSLGQVREVLREVQGSFALSLTHALFPDEVYLAVNYKPLFVGVHRLTKAVMWSSLPEYINSRYKDATYWDGYWDVKQVSPFTLMHIQMLAGTPVFTQIPLREWKENRRALIVASGGLDSTTAAAKYLAMGYETELLHFRYAARAEVSEVHSVGRIADRLGIRSRVVPISAFKEDIGHSSLTGTGDLVTGRRGEMSAEYAHEWVPARNTVFLSVAIGIAEAWDFGTVVLGNNLEESGAFPDNEVILTRTFNDLTSWIVNVDKQVGVAAPVGNLMKHEIVKLALELENVLGISFLDITHSCYEEGQPCGTCGPDYMRMKAFKMNGVIDPLEYKEPAPEGFWEGCKPYERHSSVAREESTAGQASAAS